MKIISLKNLIFIFTIIISSANFLFAQTVEELIDLLVQKNVIKQEDADSIRADIALKVQQEKESQSKFSLVSTKPLQLSGYTQARYQSFQESDKNDGADLRRIRVDVRGNISNPWDYRLQVDFASSVKVIDAYLNVSLEDYLKITVGQQKIPFSMENCADDSKLESIDRSQVVEALTARSKDVIGNHNGRDIGLQLSGSLLEYENQYLIDYALGLFNGAGINAADNNKQKDFSGRIVFHPIKGLDLGGSYYNGYDAWGSAPLKSQLRKRYGAEMKFLYEPLSLLAEYISGQDGKITKNGGYAQAGIFLLEKKLQAMLKYDRFNPDINGKNNKATIYSFGFNYFFNNWAKFQTNYLVRREESTQIKNDILELQLQLSF
jgi:phosphate-selective porin